MHGDDFHESYAHWLHVMEQQAETNESLAGMMAAALEVVRQRGTVWFDHLVGQYETEDQS
jgi:hypothetical protein